MTFHIDNRGGCNNPPFIIGKICWGKMLRRTWVKLGFYHLYVRIIITPRLPEPFSVKRLAAGVVTTPCGIEIDTPKV